MTAATLYCAGYLALPADSVPSTIAYNGFGLAAFLAVLAGVRRYRPASRAAWYIFATGLGLFVAGDVVYELTGLLLGSHPYPGWDDWIYFCAYPFFCAGMLLAARGRARRDLAGLIDAAMITVAVGLVYWVFLIGPTLAEQGKPLLERLVTVGYPCCDVLMAAVVTRLLTRRGARTASLLLLAAGTAINLVCDIAWSWLTSLAGESSTLINAGFLLSYVCWAGAALHPSMVTVTGAPRAAEVRFGRARFGLVTACTLLVPAVLFVQGARQDTISWLAIGIGAVLVLLLVLARMGGFVTRVQTQAGQLSTMVLRDDLTGLANRRRFEQLLTETVAAGPAQILLLDLNGFKAINDRHGHAFGDQLLVAVAGRLERELRDVDLVARMGGDEFAVLLAGAGAEDGDAVVVRLAAVLSAPIEVADHELLIAASIGVADTTGTEDPVEVLRRADVAMYAAKSGTTWFRRYTIELDDKADEAARLGAEMRAGLDRGQFRLVYQPIVALPEGNLRYVESLVRWQHPVRGFVNPVDFIGVAEENGLIVELGEWILRTACEQFVRWQAEHGPAAPQRISVNVSARQLAEPGFARVVADVLAATGMPADQLIVEVTETAVFGGGVAVQAVKDLHALGVRIALDDFGTGHSSLGLLQTVPVDVLKVDKSFVDNLAMAGRHAVIATALIQVSNGLGLSAVAEGVETAEQAAELHRLGYQFAQGYLFGRPVPQPDFHGTAAVAG
ncbi:MAG: bifunctional diguanylate cyclase/phosphodiesterase [Actinoplanes sp.]